MACGGAMYAVWPLAFVALFVGPFIGWHKHDWAWGAGCVAAAVVLLFVALRCA